MKLTNNNMGHINTSISIKVDFDDNMDIDNGKKENNNIIGIDIDSS